MKLTEQESDQIKLYFSSCNKGPGGRQSRPVWRTDYKEIGKHWSFFCLPSLLSSACASHPHSHKMAAPLPETSPTFQAGMKTKACACWLSLPFSMKKTINSQKPHPNVHIHLIGQNWVRGPPLAARECGQVFFFNRVYFIQQNYNFVPK